ncbi:MAG TPA: diadenylate cyclase CdaA [Armatimonadota bacterium]|jgi:diadenylate cyclase
MNNFLISIERTFLPFGLMDAFDIAVVALGIFFLLRLVRGTRAVQLIKGFVAVAIVVLFTGVGFLNLKATHWILSVILQNWVIALIILFQPELRLVVEQIGRGGFLRDAFRPTADSETVSIINEIVRAARRLSERKIGALIAVEREVGLIDIISTGRLVVGTVSSELLQTIFYPGTPMHDGGVVIREGQLAAAMCLFPLTSRTDSPRSYGTRHRAALGLSELTDAVVVIVSEETGTISIAVEGQMFTNLSAEGLKEKLLSLLQPAGLETNRWFWRRETVRPAPSAPTASPTTGEGE